MLGAIFDHSEEEIESAVFARLGVTDPIERRVLRNGGITADQIKRFGLSDAGAAASESEEEILRRLGVSPADAAKHRHHL
jgi:hypothetical protein